MLVTEMTIGTPALQIEMAIVNPTDDDALLKQVAIGNGHAFDTLYARYMPRVRAYLRKRLHDPESIDEVLNDVMMVIWKKATACPSGVPLLAWLYGIARNTARSYSRRRKFHQAESEQFGAVEEDPEFYLLQHDQQQSLHRAIQALPYHERQSVELLVYHGYSYKDIAVQLDSPVNTIKTRVMRARTRLATAMVN